MLVVLCLIPGLERGHVSLKGVGLHGLSARFVLVLLLVLLSRPLWLFGVDLYSKSKCAAVFHYASVISACFVCGFLSRFMPEMDDMVAVCGVFFIWLLIHSKIKGRKGTGS